MSNTIEQIIGKFCNQPKTIVKELEFRNQNGDYLFSIKGEQTDHLYGKLLMTPELNKTTMKIEGKGEFVVFEAIAACGYTIGGFLEFAIKKGGYIKVVTE